MEKDTYLSFGPGTHIQVDSGTQQDLKYKGKGYKIWEKVISSLIFELQSQETLWIWYIYSDLIKSNIILLLNALFWAFKKIKCVGKSR